MTDKNTNIELTADDINALDFLADEFGEWIKKNSKGKKGSPNRSTDAKTLLGLFEATGYVGYLGPHLPNISEKTGRTAMNFKKGDNWALKRSAVPVYKVSAFRHERVEMSELKTPETFVFCKWTELPEEFRSLIENGDDKRPRKIRKPTEKNKNVFKPSAMALVLRRKKGQKWAAPQWVLVGSLGEEKAVMTKALVWKTGAIKGLIEYIGASEECMPPSLRDEMRGFPEPKAKKTKAKAKKADADEFDI